MHISGEAGLKGLLAPGLLFFYISVKLWGGWSHGWLGQGFGL